MTTVQTRKDVLERLRHHRGDLRRLGVRRIGLFGSFQRDEPSAESDVDLLVEFVPGEKSFDNFMAVSFLLEEELGRWSWQRARHSVLILVLISWKMSNMSRSEIDYRRHIQDEAQYLVETSREVSWDEFFEDET
jgi:predicted nucleotidyltransferase